MAEKKTIKFTDGSIYEGDVVNGKPHGKGKRSSPSGSVHEGNWENGKIHGKGKFTSSKGGNYEGDFVNGVPHGKGKWVLSGGTTHEGDFADGKMHGKGKEIAKSGHVYEGNWANGKKNGKGKLTYSDGDVYEGDFVDNAFHGNGVYTHANGMVRSGKWANREFVDGETITTGVSTKAEKPAKSSVAAAPKKSKAPTMGIASAKSATAKKPEAAKSSVAAPAAKATSAKKVEIINFGHFEWQVLERKGNTALIITSGIIEEGPYHSVKQVVTWEDSDLRKFLNGKFLEKFSTADRARIVEVTNQNPGNPWYTKKHVSTSQSGTKGVESGDPKGGNPTKDKIFALSIEEACTYFGDSTARLKNKGFTLHGTKIRIDEPNVTDVISLLIIISDENDKNRAAENLAGKKKPVGWWLRTAGEESIRIANVFANGKVRVGGSPLWTVMGIRPALWLKM